MSKSIDVINQGLINDKFLELREILKSGNFDSTNFASKLSEAKLIQGFDINAFIDEGQNRQITLLYLAVQNRRADAIQILINSGANINEGEILYPDAIKASPIVAAVEYGYLDIVKILIANKANLNIVVTGKDSAKVSLLFIAAQNNNTHVIEFLIKNGVNSGVGEVHLDGTTYSPLFIAAQSGYLDAIESLIKNGADVDFGKVGGQNGVKASPILVAVQKGNVDVVKFLIKNGANTSVCEAYPGGAIKSLLCVALLSNQMDVVKVLIENGVDLNVGMINEHGTKISPLFIAVESGNLNAVKVLIKNGADLNVGEEYTGDIKYPPLFIAVQNGHLNIIKTLLESGVDLDLNNGNFNFTHSPDNNNVARSIKLLIKAGCKFNEAVLNHELIKPFYDKYSANYQNFISGIVQNEQYCGDDEFLDKDEAEEDVKLKEMVLRIKYCNNLSTYIDEILENIDQFTLADFNQAIFKNNENGPKIKFEEVLRGILSETWNILINDKTDVKLNHSVVKSIYELGRAYDEKVKNHEKEVGRVADGGEEKFKLKNISLLKKLMKHHVYFAGGEITEFYGKFSRDNEDVQISNILLDLESGLAKRINKSKSPFIISQDPENGSILLTISNIDNGGWFRDGTFGISKGAFVTKIQQNMGDEICLIEKDGANNDITPEFLEDKVSIKSSKDSKILVFLIPNNLRIIEKFVGEIDELLQKHVKPNLTPRVGRVERVEEDDQKDVEPSSRPASPRSSSAAKNQKDATR